MWIIQIIAWTTISILGPNIGYPLLNYMLTAMDGVWQFFGVKKREKKNQKRNNKMKIRNKKPKRKNKRKGEKKKRKRNGERKKRKNRRKNFFFLSLIFLFLINSFLLFLILHFFLFLTFSRFSFLLYSRCIWNFVLLLETLNGDLEFLGWLNYIQWNLQILSLVLFLLIQSK